MAVTSTPSSYNTFSLLFVLGAMKTLCCWNYAMEGAGIPASLPGGERLWTGI